MESDLWMIKNYNKIFKFLNLKKTFYCSRQVLKTKLLEINSKWELSKLYKQLLRLFNCLYKHSTFSSVSGRRA